MSTNLYPINNAKYNHVPLMTRLEHLVGNKYLSDCTFIIEDDNVEIPAHKLIVALASPVLERILYGNDLFSPVDCIKVDCISKEYFMEILHYIYTDTIHVNDDSVFEILQKANYYFLPGIESECLKYLELKLNVSTCPWIYHQLFYVFPFCKLFSKCLQYIRIQPLEFFGSEHFEKISIAELKSILKMDAINCTEFDLFGAVIKLSRAHCANMGLELTGANQRKVVDGAERLLRLESISESEFDKCLQIQNNFFSLTEIEKIRADIRKPGPTIIKRNWYTFEDAVWIKVLDNGVMPPSAFYCGFYSFLVRSLHEEGELPVHCSLIRIDMLKPGDQLLCGSGYEWREHVNSEIPMGAVSLSPQRPIFIAAELGDIPRIVPAFINGVLHHRIVRTLFPEYLILVAKNVKNPYNGNGVPDDAVLLGYDENNRKTYLGRAWFRKDLLPAKVILGVGAFVLYDWEEEKVDDFQFVRMDPGTYEWTEGRDGRVPGNAVTAGIRLDGEDMYFCRIMHSGNYLLGMIDTNKNLLCVPYRNHMINCRLYEVLVHVWSDSEKSTP